MLTDVVLCSRLMVFDWLFTGDWDKKNKKQSFVLLLMSPTQACSTLECITWIMRGHLQNKYDRGRESVYV